MASPLYKKPAAKGGDGEKKPAAAEPEKKPEGGEGGGEAKPAAKEPGEEVMSAWASLTASHEAERRDLHNAHKESLRTMHSRHEKQMKEFYKRNPEGTPIQPETEQKAEA